MRTETPHFETASEVLEWLTGLATQISSNRYCLSKRTERESCDATEDSPCDRWREAYENYKDEIEPAHCGGHPYPQYSLQRDGSSGWRSAPSHRIPIEIGEKLAETWKQNQYREYLGYRGVKRILKDLGADAGLNSKIKEAKKAVEAETRRRIAKQRIEKLDEFITRSGSWLSADVRIAIQQQADALSQEVS